MRMICDTNFILDPADRTCPKLGELEKLIEESRDNDAKVIVFSEWERMLQLVRDLCDTRDIRCAWHTGSVPQQRRRAEINTFKDDPACRVFLSTDSGATGLNLQIASVVINCDLPWNPAKLEQRIARAWRKHQTRPVTVFNLISENTIEHRMLETLAMKQTVAISVLDRPGEVKEIKLRSGRQAFVERLQQLVASPAAKLQPQVPKQKSRLADPALEFARLASERINGALVRCEERYPQAGDHSVIVVVVEDCAAQWAENMKSLHREIFASGKVDPLMAVQVEVIDRVTDEAIQRLIAAGLMSRTIRATRPLLPGDGATEPTPLSAEEQAKVKSHREHAARKLKIARMLGDGGFEEETRPPLLEAIHRLGCALAVARRLPEPASVRDAFALPLSDAWADARAPLQAFVDQPTSDWKQAAEALGQL
jgi:hypothetical protein